MKELRNLLLAVACMAWFVPVQAQVRETVAILGDSYSTYENYLTPKENVSWYFVRPRRELTDVDDVRQTWWWKVASEGGYKLGLNNSFSGTTICNTGYNDEDYKDNSFVTRSGKVGFLGNPDIILVFGGTNDCWAGVQMGEYKYADIKRADLYTFRPAMSALCENLLTFYPNTRLYFIINSDLSDDITESMKTVCRHYKIPFIQLHDIEKQSGHPNIKGMDQIAKQVLKVLKSGKS